MQMSQEGSVKMISLITFSCTVVWFILHELWMWLPLR